MQKSERALMLLLRTSPITL